MNPTLVIMAAGRGSRFGGLKQISPVGPAGETILDYSMYDAKKAGFEKVVFIIREYFEKEFKKQIHPFASALFSEVEYVFQTDKEIEKHLQIPPERSKPFGTAVAVLAAKDAVNEPFAVINADDFYGYSTFKSLADFLKNIQDLKSSTYAMAGYFLKNTLSSGGSVARGVCVVSNKNYLSEVKEYTGITQDNGGIINTDKKTNKVTVLDKNAVVSLNTWAFTPAIFDEIEKGIPDFLSDNAGEAFLTAEYFLPSVVDGLIKAREASVRVLETNSTWFGVTYREDLPIIQDAIKQMIKKGLYPEALF